MQVVTFTDTTASCWFQWKLGGGWSDTDDIIFSMAYTSSVGGGNIRWQLEYWTISDGGDTTPASSPTATTLETVAAPAAIETNKSITTTTLIIANADISATDTVICKLTRLGDDALDTNTGKIYLSDLIACQ